MTFQLIGVKDLTGLYRGKLIEQVIGQELKTVHTRTNEPLVFWVRDKAQAQAQAELDYLVPCDQDIIPVEAKSGATGKLRSLHQFMKRSGKKLAVRLYAGPPSRQQVEFADTSYTLVNIPYYAAAHIPAYVNALAGSES